MDWNILLTYTDGTIERLYCTTRQEARDRAAWLRETWVASRVPGATVIGRPLSSVKVERTGEGV